jgi:DNA-binding NarL/FixJ family response regulator
MLSVGAMSKATIMRALRMRFAIDDHAPEGELDPEQGGGQQEPETEAVLAELVTATLTELTQRQAQILIGLDQGQGGSDLARQLNCSTGTISHERRKIEDILARLGTEAPAVLKLVLDALFKDNG